MHVTNREPISKNWRIDDDGMLRVTARIMKEGVYDYLPEETAGKVVRTINGKIPQFVSRKEFTDAFLDTIEGKPVIINRHEWRDASNTNRDGLTVGAIAGRPRVASDGGLIADLLITDKDAIESVTKGALVEVSSAYDAKALPVEGSYNGITYTSEQRELSFNHVLLLPVGRGRMGEEVRIINTNPEGGKMKTVKVRVRNSLDSKSFSERLYHFENEKDADEAEKMAEDQKTANEEVVKEAEKKVEEKEEEKKKVENERDELQKKCNELEQRVIDLSSAETQEALAREIAAQDADEDAILRDAVMNRTVNEATAQSIKGRVVNSKTCADRRSCLVSSLYEAQGFKVENWTPDAFDGAFETLSLVAKNRVQNQRPPMGRTEGLEATPVEQKTFNSYPDRQDALLRLFKPSRQEG